MELSKRFSFGVALTLGARMLMAANTVIAGVIVARLLGAESLGLLVVLNVAVSLVIQLSNFGLPTANIYFGAKEPDILVPAAINGILFALLSGSVFAGIVLFSSPLLLPGVPIEIAALGLVSVPFQLVTVTTTTLFLSQGEVKRFNFLEFLNQSFVLTNVVVALLVLSGGLPMLFAFNAAASAGMSLLTVGFFYRYLTTRSREMKWRGDLSLLWRMMAYSLKAHIVWAAGFLVYRLDLLVVNYYRGAAEASVYGVATQCTLFLLLLPYAVSQLLQSRVASEQNDDAEFTCRVARHTSLLMFAVCIVSVPGGFLVARLYGHEFADLPLQLLLLLPGVYFVGMQVVLAQYFFGTGLPWKLPVLWALTVVVNLAINLAVVPKYGALGAALVSTFTYTSIYVVVWLYFRRATGRKLRETLIPGLSELHGLLRLTRGAGE